MHQTAMRRLMIGLALAASLGAAPARADTATRTSSFAYDATTGLLTQEVIEPNTQSLRLQTDYGRDAFGNKTTATVSGVDITTRTTTTTYDTRGQFVSTVTNALNQSESWQHDARFGEPTSHTGPNNLTTTWSYDSFGRKTLEVRADGTQTKFQYLYCSGVNNGTATCPANGAYLVQATPLAADGTTQNGPQTTAYYDSLGRAIAQDSQGFDGSTVRVAVQYDALGRIQQRSRPYFVSGGTPHWTVYGYDALGRVTLTTFPDNSTLQKSYRGLITVDTNSLNQTRTVYKNDQGQTLYVFDNDGNDVDFYYDPFGNVTSMVNPNGDTIHRTYDVRGRMISENDPDRGNWTFGYDVLGELTSKTDAAAHQTTYAYDDLGRLKSHSDPDGWAFYAYDQMANGVGKLGYVQTSFGYARQYSYDQFGRPNEVLFSSDDGSTFSGFTTSYDANGRISGVTYPSGFAVSYTRTSLGYLSQVTDAGSGQVYWTANSRDAELHLTQQTAGNGVATTQSFDPNTGLLTAIQAGTAGAVENLAYTYDTLGNLTQRTDQNADLSETFAYDDINRLISATVNAGTPTTFAYNAIGNLTYKSDVGTYTYPAAGQPQPHAVQSIGGGQLTTTFTYDADGNETAGAGRSITYTSFNMPASVTQGTTAINFSYDSEHQRFQRQDLGNGTTIYFHDRWASGALDEQFTGSSGVVQWNDYISADGAMVGVHFSRSDGTSGVRYFHKDELGSIATLTDENGLVVERRSYDAWGKQRSPNGQPDPTCSLPAQDQTTRGFIGEEQLNSVCLVHLNARLYDPYIARFAAADPVIPDPGNLQSLNRYSYGINNPLAFTDPSGMCFLGCFWKPVFHAVGQILSNPQALVAIAVAIAFVQPEVTSFIGFETGLYTTTATGAIVASDGGIVLSGAIGGALAGGISGGNLKSALTGGITGAIFAGVGNLTSNWTVNPNNTINWAGTGESAGVHAVAGGVSSVIRGGDFGSGFLSAGVTNLAGPEISHLTGGSFIGQGVARVVVGGSAAAIGGGSFANGATTAAFQYLFNASLHQRYDSSDPNYHHYQFSNTICYAAEEGCTTQNVFDSLRSYAAPGQESPAVTGGRVNVPFAGPVTQFVDNANLTVTNVTAEGHMFDPGQVERSVTTSSDGSIAIRTTGEGTGADRLFNLEVARPAFTMLDVLIRLRTIPSAIPQY